MITNRKIMVLASFCLVILLAGTFFAQNPAAPSTLDSRFTALIENEPPLSDADRLHRLFELDWEYRMIEFPTWATHVGYPGQNDRWTDLSAEAIERRKKQVERPLVIIKAIDRAKLTPADQLNYDLFRRNTENAIEGNQYPDEFLQIDQLNGIQQDIAQMINMMPAVKVSDYENMLARMRGAAVLTDQTIELMKRGLAAGVTPPRITLRDVPGQVKNQIFDDPMESPLLRPFKQFSPDIEEKDQTRLLAEAKKAYSESIKPSYEKLNKFLADTYIPGCRESIAAIDLPNGEAWYAFNVRMRTTTNLTPKEIHEIGQSEVKRIRAEMDKVIADSGFKGSFTEFCEFLRTDPQFYFTDPLNLLAEYRNISKRIDPELPRLFGTLPRLPYGVVPVPSYSEKSQTTAYYMGGSPEVGRPGYFYANTYDLKSRPKWEMEALTLHEAVPGHHLQISISQELGDLPKFRKHGGYTAFVEGWGLYAESLGPEIGLYGDSYSKFGQLTYEMWRAVRLVVDTGMHSLGWSREQAIEFFKANSSKPEHDIVVEIDRYIVWPGQALAYKIGELKFKELRARARKELGEKFDIRKFHDALLGSGALPMDVVEERMTRWIAEQKRI